MSLLKISYSLCALILLSFAANAQVSVPYYNSFDSPGDTAGWTHYAISGSDDWVMGKPSKSTFKSAYSFPNAWVTKLSGFANQSSERVLETPAFDLKDTSGKMVIAFMQYRQSYGGVSYLLEYSVNNGSSWNILVDNAAKKKNWQSTGGFSSSSSAFENSALCIKFLQGNNSVKFRFRFITNNNIHEGWLIDNFTVRKEYFNYYASNAAPIYLAQKCTNLKLKIAFGFDNQYTDYNTSTTKFYISKDSLLDGLDTLISTKVLSTNAGFDEWDHSFVYGSLTRTGKYYLLYKFDALNVLKEASETDNVGYAVIHVDSVYKVPYSDDFENTSIRNWRPYTEYSNTKLVWEKGSGNRHHIEGAHSGSKAWHTGKSSELDVYNCGSVCFRQYVESPYFDFTKDTFNNYIVNFWYKSHIEANAISIEYTSDCGTSWYYLHSLNFARNDDWDYVNIETNAFAGLSSVAFRIVFTSSYIGPEGVVFDDFYIGPKLPDLSIEKDKTDHFTSSSRSNDTLRYFINNSGRHVNPSFMPQTNTMFYWSNDSLLDMSDVYLGLKTEAGLFDSSGMWNTFAFVKPTLTAGKYYIIYDLDASGTVNEMREYNNTGYIRIYQTPTYTIPYSNTFETQTTGWRHNASLGQDRWTCATPAGKWKEKAFSGNKAWLSSDSGVLSKLSRTHLYTPVFDLRNTTNPVMEFDMVNWGDGSCNCHQAKMNMSYSIDGGATWIILDTTNSSYNRWYYPMDYEAGRDKNYYIPNYSEILFQLAEPAFALVNQYNSRDAWRNTRFILDISALKGKSNIQFRFNIGNGVMTAADSTVKGALIDNFSIRNAFTDLMVDIKKPIMLSSKANKVKFYMQVKNNGNYFSKPGIVKYYLSSNTTLDSSDYVLGQSFLGIVRPDLYYYINNAFTAPQNVNGYAYLLYYIDATNTTPESNEVNNVSYWSLALDSAVQLPYINDFSDTVQVGWHQYSIGPYHNGIGEYRFRNLLSPSEYLYQTAIHSQEYFTDRILSGNWNTPPMLYLETPPFNFMNDDSIRMSFDLMCTGTGSDGGTMRYSTDGGNTWQALKDLNGTGKNWFNRTSMSVLNNDPGWAKPTGLKGLNAADTTSIDISYLKGIQDVRFQFAYKSNYEALGGGTPQGMRLDNFIVEGSAIDFIADKPTVVKSLPSGTKNLNMNYSITCTGSSAGRASLTKFYWSKDSVFDSGDIFLSNKQEDWMKTGTTINTTFQLPIPDLDTQTVYYVFYRLDGDYKLNEVSETNNVGTWKLLFSKSANYTSKDTFLRINAVNTQAFVQVRYTIKNTGKMDGKNSETQFYWSNDSVFNPGDVLVKSVYQGSILAADSVQKKVKINFPQPLTQSVYYLFYKADGKDSIAESNENDNVGTYKIVFSNGTGIQSQLNGKIRIYTNGSKVYLDIQEQTGIACSIEVYNSLGQRIYGSQLSCETGIQTIDLGQYIADGFYLIRFASDGKISTGMYYLESE